jgi:N-acetylglutamate synthase-like GNAT family acetyltransferase
MKILLKKILSVPLNLIYRYNRTIQDYVGSYKVIKYTHISKKIRTFNDDDLERILELLYVCFGEKYYSQVIKYSKVFRNIFYIYEQDGIIVAYFGFYVHVNFDNFKLVQKATCFSACVDEQQRGKGIYSSIFNECLSELRNNNVKVVYACIEVNNTTSLHVHQKIGFKIINKKDRKCEGDNLYEVELKLDE